MNIYGVVSTDKGHTDVSHSLRGAKCYATSNGYNIVSIRYNCGYIAKELEKKVNGRWVKID